MKKYRVIGPMPRIAGGDRAHATHPSAADSYIPAKIGREIYLARARPISKGIGAGYNKPHSTQYRPMGGKIKITGGKIEGRWGA